MVSRCRVPMDNLDAVGKVNSSPVVIQQREDMAGRDKTSAEPRALPSGLVRAFHPFCPSPPGAVSAHNMYTCLYRDGLICR